MPLFFFQAEDGIRDVAVTGVQTCALPISHQGVRARQGHPACALRVPDVVWGAARPAARAAAPGIQRARVRPVRHPVVPLSHAPARRAAGERGVPRRQRAAGVPTAELTDGTLGGYQRVHERAPAFSGSDGQSYSVGTYVDDAPDAQGRYGAALLFVRWSDAGDRPVGHLETDYLSRG